MADLRRACRRLPASPRRRPRSRWSPSPRRESAQDRTFLSAVVVRDWLRRQGGTIDAVDLFSGGVHARRSRLVYRIAFGPEVDVGVFAAPPRRYDARALVDDERRRQDGARRGDQPGLDDVLLLAARAGLARGALAGAEDRRPERFTPFARPAVQRGSSPRSRRTAMPTRRALLTLLAAAAASACTSPPAAAVGSLVDVQIVDRSRGETLSTWRHRGASYVAGRPGDRYAVRLTNRSPAAASSSSSRSTASTRSAARPPRCRRPATCSRPTSRPRSPAGARAIPRRRRSTSPPCPTRTPRAPAGPTTSA